MMSTEPHKNSRLTEQIDVIEMLLDIIKEDESKMTKLVEQIEDRMTSLMNQIDNVEYVLAQ